VTQKGKFKQKPLTEEEIDRLKKEQNQSFEMIHLEMGYSRLR